MPGESDERVPMLTSLTLALLALGIVFGDIGTSPLYVLTAILGPDKSFYTPPHIIGANGIIFWILILVVTAFYCGVVLKINLNGDGGITVLYGMAHRQIDRLWARVGIAGVIADGQITPAISTLSAWWGLLAIPGFVTLTTLVQNHAVSYGWIPHVKAAAALETQRAALGEWIAIALTLASLVVLFAIQKKGTNKIGAYFGPVMFVWFAMLTYGGMPQITQHPSILLAPLRFDYMWALLTHDLEWWKSPAIFAAAILSALTTFGAGLLAATGGEALYADMGHFGRRPVVTAWALVMIGLLTNYFGQCASMVTNGYTDTPFFALYKNNMSVLAFMVGLAVAATFIASQALLTGCFSLVVQAIRLRLVPRVRIIFTSNNAAHVYVPMVNAFLLIGEIGFVLIFRDPNSMTYAYGMAVGTTMTITYTLIRRIRKEQGRRLWFIDLCGVLIVLLTIGAYSKLLESLLGLIPLCSMVMFTFAMTIWGKGQRIILETEYESDNTPTFRQMIDCHGDAVIAPITRVFLCSRAVGLEEKVPLALQRYLYEQGAWPRTAAFVHIEPVVNKPYVNADDEVASIEIYGVCGSLKRRISILLKDLPPRPIRSQVLTKWIRDSLDRAPQAIQEVVSADQMSGLFDGHAEPDPKYRLMPDEDCVALVTIRWGRKDPPFLVSVLRCLGVSSDEAKVVAHRPVFLIDSKTTFGTRLWVHVFRWIRDKVQTLPEYLGVPLCRAMFVTLQVDPNRTSTK